MQEEQQSLTQCYKEQVDALKQQLVNFEQRNEKLEALV